MEPDNGTALATKSRVGTREEHGLGLALQSRSGELAIAATAAGAKAEVEAAYTIALHRPRSVANARAKILESCARPRFAEVARYSKPVAGQAIVGPSIRFVETAIQAYGNVRVSSTTVYEDEDVRKIHVSVTDLEGNLSYGKDVTIQKTVERSFLKKGQVAISERVNTSGAKVFLVKATEDELANKTAALESKVIRNGGLRLLPRDIVEEAMDAVELSLSKQDSQDPQAARKKMADAFQSIGVMPADLEAFLGHPIAQTTPKEMDTLRMMFTAIKDGEASWSDYAQGEKIERGSLKISDLKAGKTESHVHVGTPTPKQDSQTAAPIAHTAGTGTNAEDSKSAPLPPSENKEQSNREYLEEMQKKNDAKLTAKQKAMAKGKPKKKDAPAEESSDDSRTGANGETKTPEAVTEYICAACKDTGKNSRGAPCAACQKLDKATGDPFSQAAEAAPEDDTLRQLEANYEGTSGMPVEELRNRCNASWKILSADDQKAVIAGLHLKSPAEMKEFNPMQLRKFLEETISVYKAGL